MKKSYLTMCLLLCSIFSFADNENVCVVTNTGGSGQACSASTLGFVDPCRTLSFVVNYQIPAGFVIVAKYEWLVNGVSVKTTTTPSDPILNWQIKAKATTVLCKVTYKKQDGTLSQVFTSTSFTPNIKQLNFADNGVTATTPPPNFGCTTNTVSYSLNTFTCTGDFCSGVYNVGQYNITWQPPSGWTQTSISTNGNNVSFLPDASSAGTLTATITLFCGYIDTRTFNVNRAAEKPTFSGSGNTICTSSANVAINSICGAVDYTYSIVGSSGITFAANGLQTFTTSNTSPTLSLSGNASTFVLKAKATYPGNIVSAEASKELIYGTPTPSGITGFSPTIGVSPGEILELSVPETFATSYNWDVAGGAIVSNAGQQITVVVDNPCNGFITNGYFNVGVSYNNTCGTGNPYGANCYIVCGAGLPAFAISPNPSSDNVTIDGRQKNKSIKEVQIVDKLGNVKKVVKYSGEQKLINLNISTLPADIYYIRIFDGQKWESKQLKKQ